MPERIEWTDRELADIRLLASSRWPSEVTAGSAETWREWRRSLEPRLAYEDVMAAIISLSETEKRFPPLAVLLEEGQNARAARFRRINGPPPPADEIDLEHAATDGEQRWNDRVKARYVRPMEIVRQHEATGIPLDRHAYPGVRPIDIDAAMLRCHYDRQIAAGVPINPGSLGERFKWVEGRDVGEHEQNALAMLERIQRGEFDCGVVARELVESYCAALRGERPEGRLGARKALVGVSLGAGVSVAPGPSQGRAEAFTTVAEDPVAEDRAVWEAQVVYADWQRDPAAWTPERVDGLDPGVRAVVRALVARNHAPGVVVTHDAVLSSATHHQE